jgi:hypothetical protein
MSVVLRKRRLIACICPVVKGQQATIAKTTPQTPARSADQTTTHTKAPAALENDRGEVIMGCVVTDARLFGLIRLAVVNEKPRPEGTGAKSGLQCRCVGPECCPRRLFRPNAQRESIVAPGALIERNGAAKSWGIVTRASQHRLNRALAHGPRRNFTKAPAGAAK